VRGFLGLPDLELPVGGSVVTFDAATGRAKWTPIPWGAPGAIGSTTPSSGAFTTLSASGVITSTLATGTAPFTVASTTVVANLNVSQLLGSTWAAPGTIGSGTPSTGAFTTLNASGLITASSGVKFASGTGTLNYYEEGTWTPTLIGSSVAGTQTYVVQNGRYTRVGSKVYVEFYVEISAKGGTMAGDVEIGGLPFTVKNVANYYPTANVGVYQGWTLAAGRTQLIGRGVPNTTTIYFYSVGSAVNASGVDQSNIAAATQVYGSLAYEV
jgi:hypothetical protein